MKRIKFVVPANATVSQTVNLADWGFPSGDIARCALAALECPATLTSTAAQIEESTDNSAWLVCSPSGTADSLTVGSADGNSVRKKIPLDPTRYYTCGKYLRLRMGSSEAAERVIYLWVSEVS
jgi:hypothetical protein